MLSNRTFLVFLLKALVVYGILSYPVPIINKIYGDYYRAICKQLYGSFRNDGFVWFTEGSDASRTIINIGNYKQVNAQSQTVTTKTEANIRFRGYLPTVLLISLILASPIGSIRKLKALLVGLLIVNLLIFFKQWLQLLYICGENQWLHLFNPTETTQFFLNLLNAIFLKSSGAVLYFTVAIWILVTFRLRDFQQQGAVL